LADLVAYKTTSKNAPIRQRCVRQLLERTAEFSRLIGAQGQLDAELGATELTLATLDLTSVLQHDLLDDGQT
jgi:hypothetical protein